MTDQRPVVFSGIKPSGNLHIGNYIGAIRHWLENQGKKENVYCIVDLHAITVPQDPQRLQDLIWEELALYLACGLDPKKNNIFVQSHNLDHAQLAWILDCFTPMGWMRRMTQYKSKSKKQKEAVSVGLFNYPVLMAADILLYQTNEVPVGDDQKQHVEVTRDIAERFNSRYGEVLTLPQAVIHQEGARIMSLREPKSKMSKSDPNAEGTLYLLDSPEDIQRKIRTAVTDSGHEIRRGNDKPALTNLLTIYAALCDKSVGELEEEYQGQGYGDFKQDLAEVVINFLRPIQARYQELCQDGGYLTKVVSQGLAEVKPRSAKTLMLVEKAVGLG